MASGKNRLRRQVRTHEVLGLTEPCVRIIVIPWKCDCLNCCGAQQAASECSNEVWQSSGIPCAFYWLRGCDLLTAGVEFGAEEYVSPIVH